MTVSLVWFLLTLAVCAACVFGFLWQRRSTRRTVETLHRMLDAAIDGSFAQHTFDESLSSSVEAKLNHYLSAAQTGAHQIAREKDNIKQLIADISHQTKTPIANILLYAQLLAEQALPPESAQCVAALDAQAQKLSFLIAALVKLSRLETGVLTLHPQPGPVAPVLRAAAAQCAPAAKAKGVALTLALSAPDEEIRAVLDAKWTAEALANLMDNAVKYTPAGGSVTVRVLQYDLFCRIDVADTGPGIAPDEHAKIFTRFYRAPEAAQTEGVGIGLYLTRQILSAQGGYVKVASQPGSGAVFSAYLPREDAAAV